MKLTKFIYCIIFFTIFSFNLLMSPVYSFSIEEDDLENDAVNMENTNNFESNSYLVDNLRVNARCAIAIDGETNQILFAQNAFEIVPMASTTKIMTALIAINYGDLDREVVISKNAASIRGSKVGYSAGESIKMKELIFGLMFKSGNDAAIAIAKSIVNISIIISFLIGVLLLFKKHDKGFSKIMNDFANSLGIMCSNYESPHGLDSQKHYSSAYDLAILTSKAMKNELFREICGSKTIAKETYGFTRDYQNINKILWKIPNANGVKTGYTGQAGKCLVTSVNHEGRDIIIVVLNCTDRWNQTEKIYNHVCSKYIFKNDSTKNLVESMGMIKLASVLDESDFAYGFKENEKIEIEVFSPIGDVHKGDTLGKLSLYDENTEVTKTNFKACKDLSKECFEEIIS